jgi:hypothetical protein
MRNFADSSIMIALGLALCLGAKFAQAEGTVGGTPTIRRISVIAGSSLELEIAGSGPLKPRVQVIQGPDRLVLDFPGALPAKGLHNLDINRGDVKGARVGIFSSDPPVTRVVLDLKSPQPYQLFPSGNTVVVKFGANTNSKAASNLGAPNPAAANPDDSPETIVSIERAPREVNISNRLVAPTAQASAVPARVPPSLAQTARVEVSFEKGLLSIRSNKANLAEILAEVHRQTGAEIAIPAGAESEQVFTSLGPGAPKEVLASLLNGSHFNFIVIGSERDPGGIRRVVLTPKEGGAAQAVVYPCGSTTQPAMAQAAPDPEPPVQAYGAPMPPEQTDLSDQPPPPPQQ